MNKINVSNRNTQELYLITVNDMYFHTLKYNFKALVKELNKFYDYSDIQLLYLLNRLNKEHIEELQDVA